LKEVYFKNFFSNSWSYYFKFSRAGFWDSI